MSRTETVANKMRELRKSWSFRQEDIANFLGVDASLISRAEAGDRALSVDMLEKLSNLYGISLSELENESEISLPYTRAFRAGNVSKDDMDAICAINRIARNAAFLEGLLGGEES